MKLKCCLCGKEEIAFSKRLLSEDMPNYSLCNECANIKATLNAKAQGVDIRSKEIDKCKQYIVTKMEQNRNMDLEVKNYFDHYISDIMCEIEEIDEANIRQRKKEQEIEDNFSNLQNFVLLTTGYDFQGYKIVDYISIVSSECVIGTGILSEFTASITDTFGAKSSSFSNKISEAKQNVLDNMKKKTILQDGNAIIGVDFDITTFNNNMIAVLGTGTCVRIEKNKK